MAMHDNDYLHRHTDEKVALTVRSTRDGSACSDSISYAARMGTQRARQLFGSIALESDAKTWIVANAELSEVSEIRPGDRLIEANDTTWRVDAVARDTVGTQWICLCTKHV